MIFTLHFHNQLPLFPSSLLPAPHGDRDRDAVMTDAKLVRVNAASLCSTGGDALMISSRYFDKADHTVNHRSLAPDNQNFNSGVPVSFHRIPNT